MENLETAKRLHEVAVETLSWTVYQDRYFARVPRVMVTSARWAVGVREARIDAIKRTLVGAQI